jgi:hypothetical protein
MVLHSRLKIDGLFETAVDKKAWAEPEGLASPLAPYRHTTHPPLLPSPLRPTPPWPPRRFV